MNNSEVGTNLRGVPLIQDLVDAVTAEQGNVEAIASSNDTNETDIMHAFAITDLLTQVLSDFEDLAAGRKRRFEDVLNVAQMVQDIDRQDSKNDADVDLVVDPNVVGSKQDVAYSNFSRPIK
ncbi:hypothetical protein RFI_18377 [Reticulomyxa filosa]|uniref:Uncharacterized protein n=1 Tax=Reticulomyxa filosa TaxID=46433 RepID=X6MZI3_RETFI|nr:hypothetical protein RFI_18377 [Reticulomyxa filosa]|eukprot:ETO18869.1 hypothetical protein RFI_18377 [Reticulomyxa filosa]